MTDTPIPEIQSILFLCVANSARSQMAEGIAKAIFGLDFSIQSAGSAPSQVNPYAITVMAENGIDITRQRSKSVEEIDPTEIDLVITLCKEEVCPVVFSKAKRLHWPLQDPDRKNEILSDSKRLEYFRTARNQIQDRLNELKKRFHD